MEEKITVIKEWLGTGSINVFGLPMSGKDTVGIRLAETLGARFLSSGMVIRAMEEAKRKKLTSKGFLIPSDLFSEWVLPYFEREDLKDDALVLSSVGRWQGEERLVIERAKKAGHEIKAAVILNISEADVFERWQAAKLLRDRGDRLDDRKEEVFEQRIEEFRKKTLPVIKHYFSLGILIQVRADGPRDEVFLDLIEQLYQFARNQKV